MLGCPTIWGVSDNDSRYLHATYLGWRPRDNAERLRTVLEKKSRVP